MSAAVINLRAAGRVAVAICLIASLMGCATVKGGDGANAASTETPSVVRVANPKDPFEPWNRKVYAFNDAIDEAVLKPVATAYTKVMPVFIRTTIKNFFGNFGDAWSTVNHFLQGKVQTGLEMGMRVAVNSTFGLGGLLDIASEAGLERKDEDFGQTLGRWGVPAGPYLVWPLLGPSSMRETAALPLDRGWSPSLVINDGGVSAALTGVQLIETRAQLLGASRTLDDIALDKYTFVRDAYLTRRRNQVYDGDPPEEKDEEEPAAAPKKTSAAEPAGSAVASPEPSLRTPASTKSASGVSSLSTAAAAEVAEGPGVVASSVTVARSPDVTPAKFAASRKPLQVWTVDQVGGP